MTTPDSDFVAFLRAHPQYPTTKIIDDLRAVEYSRLDIGGNIYLITLAAAYMPSRNCARITLACRACFWQPSFEQPTSQAATQLVEHAREYVLKFFNAAQMNIWRFFTSNARRVKACWRVLSIPGGAIY